MKWADCTVIYDKSVSRMKNLNTSGPPGSTYIEVQWKLECGDRIGSIEGFIVYYCPIPGPGLQYCKGLCFLHVIMYCGVLTDVLFQVMSPLSPSQGMQTLEI